MDLVASSDTALTPPDARGDTGWISVLRAVSSAIARGASPARVLRATSAPCRVCSLGSDGRSDPVGAGLHHCARRTADLLGARPRIESAGAAGWIPTPFATALDRIAQTPAERVGLVVEGSTTDEALRVARLAADAGARVGVEGAVHDRAALSVLREVTGVAAGTVGFDALAAAEIVIVWGPVTATPMMGRWLGQAAGRGTTVVAVVDGPRPSWAQHVVPSSEPASVALGTLSAVEGGIAHGWLAGLLAGRRDVVSTGSGWSEELTRALLGLHLALGAIGRRGAGLLPLPVVPNALGAAEAGLLDHDSPTSTEVDLLLRVPAGPVGHPDGHTTTSADRRVRVLPYEPDASHDGFGDWVAIARALGAEVPWSRPLDARRDGSLRRPGDHVQRGGPWLHDGGLL
ncbi:MAG: hypothetical protein H6735_09970 [Alphaproteobacteria bacterium]|nr:hypothetical protein [Alphaproteobacteria bacterium]